MKRALLAALLTGATLFLSVAAHATPPKEVVLAYDAAAQSLSVTIRHWSLADGLHYVKYVEMSVNGELRFVNTYKEQPGTEYTYSYSFQAGPGDMIEVTAKCNLWGKRSATLTVPGAGAAPGGTGR